MLRLAVLLSILASPVYSQECALREVLIWKLQDRYDERRVMVGVDAGNGLLEVFHNEDTGGWTIIRTEPSGQSCVVSAGTALELLSDPLPGKL